MTATSGMPEKTDISLSTGLGRQAWQTLAVTSVGVFVVFLDATVVSVAFPALSKSFPGASRGELSWVLNAYSVVFGALLITAGRTADSVGRRRTYQTGLLAFAALSALCGAAGNVWLLVAMRALQGIGAAAIVPASLGLLLAAVPENRRSTAVGLWGAAGAAAAASGPVAGALLAEYASWRWVFWLNLPVCLAAFAWGQRVLPPDAAPRRPALDGLGAVLLIGGIAAVSLALAQAADWGWASAGTVGVLAGAAAVLGVFAARSKARVDAVIPLPLLRDRAVQVATAATLLSALAFYANLLCNVLFLTDLWGDSLLVAAVSVLPTPLLTTVAAGPAGRLAERIGHRPVLVAGTVLFAAGHVWYLVALGQRADYALLLIGLVCVGLGIGVCFPTLSSAAAVALPPQLYSAGGALVSTARQLGAALGVSLLVGVLGEGALRLADFRRAWLLLAVESLVAAGVAALYPAGRVRFAAVPPTTPPTEAGRSDDHG